MNNKEIKLLKITILSIIAGIFIYYRKLDYYASIPRENIWASLAVILWTFVTLYEPYFLVVGLVLLNLFGVKHESV
jgi:hypothetical protein